MSVRTIHCVTLGLAAAFLSAQSPSGALFGIRSVYETTNHSYEIRDAASLAKTVLPGFYAVTPTGQKISHATIDAALRSRFAKQVQCVRDERAVTLAPRGARAIVKFVCSDQSIRIEPRLGRILVVETSDGTSYWVLTHTGWKQEHIVFAHSTVQRYRIAPGWRIPRGGWQAIGVRPIDESKK